VRTRDARAGRDAPEGVERTAPAGRPSRWFRRFPASHLRISLAYALFAAAWIGFSDRAVERLFADHAARERAQTSKGIAFVALTATLLHFFIRRSERTLRSVGAEMRATIDSMTDAVILVDGRARIVEANRAALELFGAAAEDILGPIGAWADRHAIRHADGTLIPHHRLASVRALAGERVMPYDAILRRADGADVFVSITASPVYTDARPPLAVAVLRDVSAARRLDEVRDEFLSTAAHEFKTPLAVVKAYTQLLRKRNPADAQALAVILRQVERLSRLVEHLLDASRARSGGRALRRERFDLAALAAEVIARMRESAPRHTLALHGERTAEVDADRERVERVMMSLVDNAIRFSPAGGEIRIALERQGNDVVFSVQDHGLGIPLERQARIFERYYRAHAGTPDDYGGLGIGLDMSRETIERLGGRMWFESAPAQGSHFHFSLPLAPPPAAEARA
jgi:two-component system, OmpR family, phosphate regulon sensor histidine kinase PhoR